jgi:uracil-DNA glycosylase
MNDLTKIDDHMVNSLVDWWKNAGVDYFVCDDPQNWFADSVETESQSLESKSTITPVLQETPPFISAAHKWPSDINILCSEMKVSCLLPGSGFGGKAAAPVANSAAKLMIVSDIPDVDEIEAGMIGAGAAGKLLTNMLAVINLKLDDCYVTALATTRPATGELPEHSFAESAGFMMHQMKLVKPKAMLVLGSTACQALLNAELMSARGNLHYINHDGQKVTAIPTFHPRTLLARPILKAQSWRDLQILINKGYL